MVRLPQNYKTKQTNYWRSRIFWSKRFDLRRRQCARQTKTDDFIRVRFGCVCSFWIPSGETAAYVRFGKLLTEKNCDLNPTITPRTALKSTIVIDRMRNNKARKNNVQFTRRLCVVRWEYDTRVEGGNVFFLYFKIRTFFRLTVSSSVPFNVRNRYL